MFRATRLRIFGILTVALLALAPVPAAAAADTDLVVNGSFEQFAGANPQGWNRWAAAGTGSVARVAGQAGANAVQVTTDTTSSRLALTQDVAVPASGGLFRLDFTYRLTGMSGSGTAGVRVNTLGVTAPAPFIGGRTDTAGWQAQTALVRVPVGATGVRLHVFNDMVRGQMQLDDLRFVQLVSSSYLTSSITAAGDIGLSWEVESTNGVDSYDIHRADSGPVVPTAQNLVRRVPASVSAASDQDWTPGATYTYLVVARNAAGEELFRTQESSIAAPTSSNVLSSSIVALDRDGRAHLSWAVAAETSGPVAVFGSNGSVSDGDLSGASPVVEGVRALGSVDLDTSYSHFALVAGGEVVATASRADANHPRIMLTDEVLAKVDRLIAVDGTPRELYDTVVSRVDKGVAGAGTTPDRYSREAAFLFQVTGEQRYADRAFEGFQAAAAATPFTAKQALDTANPTSHLALTYDWAYPGWSPQQRSYAQEYFERTSAFLELADHPNMVWPDKGSNWVGVTRGAELAQHLAVRGDGDYGLRDARIARLVDELQRHLDQGYTDQGWYQEGLDYLDYDSMIATSGILASFDAGIDALSQSWHTPETTDLLLHAVSLRNSPGASLQWGVGTGGTAAWPLYFDRAVDDGNLGRLAAMYERTQGHLAATPLYSPAFALYTFAYWPEDAAPALESDEALPALLDDEAGSAMFRNRIQDANDVLVGLNNRNHEHLGWSGFDTFGLSLLGGGTTWGSQPGKDQSAAAKYSRVLVDGQVTQAVGEGVTLGQAGFDGQGGGYVHFDGSGNLGVDTATREAVVDMTSRSAADTVIALSDSFSDDTSHTWTWQLAPQAGVSADIADGPQGSRVITLRNGDAWLRGWLLNAQGAEVTFEGGVLRIVRTGQSADFDLVLALGSGAQVPAGAPSGKLFALDGFVADLDHLSEFQPASARAPWTVDTVYGSGDRVVRDGKVYEAMWYARGGTPGVDVYGPWQEIAESAGTVLWTPTRVFHADDAVVHDGVAHTAKWYSRNQSPGPPHGPWAQAAP